MGEDRHSRNATERPQNSTEPRLRKEALHERHRAAERETGQPRQERDSAQLTEGTLRARAGAGPLVPGQLAPLPHIVSH